MIRQIAEPLLACGVLAIGVLVLRAGESHRANQDIRRFELHFPRGLDAKSVTTFLAGLSGVRPPWFKSWLRIPVISFEVWAADGAIHHHLVIPRSLTGSVMTPSPGRSS